MAENSNGKVGRRGVAAAVVACTLSAGVAVLNIPTALADDLTAVGRPAPNVVLFLLDDLGYADTGMMRPDHTNRRGSTPTLDRISREGVGFVNASASPNCSPTRASLLTGTQSANPDNLIFTVNGLDQGGDNTLLRGPHQGQPDQPTGAEAIPERAVTVAETLRANGYATAAFGKFHVAGNRDQVTQWHGFDVNYGSGSTGHPGAYTADENNRFNPMVQGGLDAFAQPYTREYVDEHIAPYSTNLAEGMLDRVVGARKNVQDAMADAMESYLDSQSGAGARPFFVHVGSFAVHFPIDAAQARPDLRAKYGADTATVPRTSTASPAYEAILEGADQTVARLVDALETTPDPRNQGRPMAENTIVFFTSDNGGDVRYGADNGPYRAGKSTTWEGGVRVPWVVWSGNRDLVPAGGFRHQMINASDFYPTLVEATGAVDHNPNVDGVSWWKAVTDPTQSPLLGTGPRAARVVHVPGYMTKRSVHPTTSIRQGPWKAVYHYESGLWTLFDVDRDPAERVNLARAEPAVLGRLARSALTWAQATRPPLATVRKPGFQLVVKNFTGTVYRSSGVVRVRKKTLRIRYGQQAPLLVPASFKAKQKQVAVLRPSAWRQLVRR